MQVPISFNPKKEEISWVDSFHCCTVLLCTCRRRSGGSGKVRGNLEAGRWTVAIVPRYPEHQPSAAGDGGTVASLRGPRMEFTAESG